MSHAYSSEPYSVLIYGDSNTWGFDPQCLVSPNVCARFPYQQRWTSQCQAQLGNEYKLFVEALNARTTILSDVSPPPNEGEYDVNGRVSWPVVLHMHKPLDIVVISLSTNDLRRKHGLLPTDICAAVRVLIKDVLRQTAIGTPMRSHEVTSDQEYIPVQAPEILVIGPPLLKSTPMNLSWGFYENIEEQSRLVAERLAAMCEEVGVSFMDLGPVADVCEIDGIHFLAQEQIKIASAVAQQLHVLAARRK